MSRPKNTFPYTGTEISIPPKEGNLGKAAIEPRSRPDVSWGTGLVWTLIPAAPKGTN